MAFYKRMKEKMRYMLLYFFLSLGSYMMIVSVSMYILSSLDRDCDCVTFDQVDRISRKMELQPNKTFSTPLTIIVDRQYKEIEFWLYDMLKELNRPLEIYSMNKDLDYGISLLKNDSLLILSDYYKPIQKEICKRRFSNIGLFHLADEFGWADVGGYRCFDYVLRTYYSRHFFDAEDMNVIWIPNGYPRGVGPRNPYNLRKASHRRTLCYFEGSPKDNGTPNSRSRFLRAVKYSKAKDMCNVISTGGFFAGKDAFDYSLLLQDTIFALSPAGNSGETIRFYESLENGAIPLMVKEDFVIKELADHPFEMLNDWEDLTDFLEEHATNITYIDDMQEKTLHWWNSHKNFKRLQIANEVNDAFSRYSRE